MRRGNSATKTPQLPFTGVSEVETLVKRNQNEPSPLTIDIG
jgi:hypothetical protein